MYFIILTAVKCDLNIIFILTKRTMMNDKEKRNTEKKMTKRKNRTFYEKSATYNLKKKILFVGQKIHFY